MFNRRTNIDTMRRSSQRRINKSLARIQRKLILETVVSNLCRIDELDFQNNVTSACTSQSISTEHEHEHVHDGSDRSIIEHEDDLNDSATVESKLLDIVDSEGVILSTSNENNNDDISNNVNNVDIEDTTSELDSNEDRNESIYDKYLGEDHMDEVEIDDDTDQKDLFDDMTQQTDRNFNSREIAVALSLLKSRHALTHVCITHICKLLKMLRVPDTPSDARHVRSLICSRVQTNIFGDTLISCSSCHKISKFSTHCSENQSCISKEKFFSNPTITHILRLEPQIRSIVERNSLLKPNNDLSKIRDITDGKLYRKLASSHTTPIITLLMNSDGAVVKSISRSIWVTTFVVNELPWNIRFNRENIITAMISSGSIKPSKSEMQIFLKHLMKELLHLEQTGFDFTSPSSSATSVCSAQVFVIGAVCDKPAASLLINHTEAGGYYGCIHCNVVGENVKVGDGHARVFPFDKDDEIRLRSNDTYDEAIALLEKPSTKTRRVSITSINNGLEGLRGKCELRALQQFDVYQSFLSDTLHTLYEGAMARMLRIFFDGTSIKNGITSEMSIKEGLSAVSAIIASISYPSTTYRIPRDLKHYNIYKANEYKMVLLFGFNAFDQVLDKNRYDHFRCLAFAAHLIESTKVDKKTHSDVNYLLQEFYEKFHILYTKQQVKPVIHALSHFAKSVENYGPAFRYSTFEFESTVAQLTRLIHNGNAPTVELLRNLDLAQQTWLALSDTSSSIELKNFDRIINCNMRYAISAIGSLTDEPPIRFYKKVQLYSLAGDTQQIVIKVTGEQSFKLFTTILFEGQRFASDSIDTFRRTHDGCLMYAKNDSIRIGFMEVVVCSNNLKTILVIRPVNLLSTADSMQLNNRTFRCTNVLYGTCCGTVLEIIDPKSIIQKLAFRRGVSVNFPPTPDSMFFFQYPNRSGST